MQTVSTETSLAPPEISVDGAKQLTGLIRESLEAALGHLSEAWELLLEAHDRHAWRVLGYDSWGEYVRTEFDMSRSRSYQLLDQARVTRALMRAAEMMPLSSALDTATSDSSSLVVSSRQARAIKPKLREAVADVRDLVWKGTPVVQAVQTVVAARGKNLSKSQKHQIGRFIDQQVEYCKGNIRGFLHHDQRFTPEEFVRALNDEERGQMRQDFEKIVAWIDKIRGLL